MKMFFLVIFSSFAYAEFTNGQGLQVTSLPSVLFNSNDGLHNVVEGSVIQLYCSVESTTASFSWTKNGSPVIIDVPHLRERTSSDSTTTTSVLTVDNFQSSDTGTYQCSASDGMRIGNGENVTLTVYGSSVNGDLSIVDEPVNHEMMFESLDPFNQRIFLDNRTGVPSGMEVNSSLLVCQVRRMGMSMSPPTVTWIANGRAVSTSNCTSCFISSLTIPNLSASDAGVYQCIFTDTDATQEVVTSIPLRLDTDIYTQRLGIEVNTLYLENISPEVIFLHPPEKLVIEVRTRGRYSGISWEGNSFPIDRSSLSNHDEIFVRGRTTEADHGLYQVVLLPSPPIFQDIIPDSILDFIVTAPVNASTRANHDLMLSVMEGGFLRLSCTSLGAPTPAIVWEMNGQPAPFNTTQVTTIPQAQLVGAPGGGLAPNVTLGNITSEITITNAQYPAENGSYTCFGSNDDFETNSSALIHVQVLVTPVIEVTASRMRVNIGASTTLFCNVTRTNPEITSYTWMDENTSTVINIGNMNTLVLTLLTEQNFGTISCTATNAAGISGKANVIIEQGFPPEIAVVDPDPVFFDEPVQLVCTVIGGDPPRNITWAASNGTQVYFTNQIAGAKVSLSITRYDYGEYMCIASNEFGTTSRSVQVQHPVCFNNTYGIDCSEICFCMNGGTCDSAIGCMCTDGWTGTNCTIELNRFSPEFSNSTPKFVLLKWTTEVGTMVIDINATDADPTLNAGRISYSLVSPDYHLPHIVSNGTVEFGINATSGVVTTVVDLETRADMYSSFYLTILATDNGVTPLSSTTQITILPLPVPRLVNPANVTVEENIVNDRIADIECFVIGHTFSVPTVSITAYGNYSQYFSVEPTTQYTFALYTSRGLDYESLQGNPFIEIELLCEIPSVNGIPCIDSRMIEIEVLNVNDNHIRFENVSYYLTMPENITGGTGILTLRTLDEDSPNDTVIFSFVDSNAISSFIIDPNTGQIIVTSQLDPCEQQDKYVLKVRAYQLNSGDEAFTNVTITLYEVNDEPCIQYSIIPNFSTVSSPVVGVKTTIFMEHVLTMTAVTTKLHRAQADKTADNYAMKKSVYISTVQTERDYSQTVTLISRKAIAGALVSLVALLFIGLISVPFVIVACKYWKKRRSNEDQIPILHEMCKTPHVINEAFEAEKESSVANL